VIPTNYYGTLFSQLSHLKKLADGLRIVDTCPIFLQLGLYEEYGGDSKSFAGHAGQLGVGITYISVASWRA
jgi:hypothetical protein